MTKSPLKAKVRGEITPKTPLKQKPSSTEDLSVTPPKQKKIDENKCVLTPSTLLKRLNLDSPEKSPPKTPYQNARRALHSSVPTKLPGRENELKELHQFIDTCIYKKSSSSLYISGPPGTGKTAALSIILDNPKMLDLKKAFINCTGIKSSRAIYTRIIKELGLKVSGCTEKDRITAIVNYLKRSREMILLILDEIDQLDSKDQSVLYTIFEWPAMENSNLILIGVANALDLTDRILPRLQARCELKPKLMHFAPYTKQQLIHIFTERLNETSVSNLFSPVAIQMLAAKVAAVSGDVRKALDIGRRAVEMVEQNGSKTVLQSIENVVQLDQVDTVELDQVKRVLNSVYSTSQNLNDNSDDAIPLQQRIIICSLLLIIRKGRSKDVTVGKLHDIYKKVCNKRNLLAVDQAEFVGLCSLIETRGIIKVIKKKEPRLHKITLQWDQEEVMDALKDKQLMSSILLDDKCLGQL